VAAGTASKKRSRRFVTWITGVIIFIAAIPAALSSSSLSTFTIFNKSIFDGTDYLVSNLLLPFGSLLIALFIVHKMDEVIVKEEFHLSSTVSPTLYRVWYVLMKWVVPITIIVVFFNTLGLI